MLFRLCAVFGGVYHLKRAANSVIISQQGGEPHCAGIVSGSQRLSTEHLVMAVSDAPKTFLQSAPTGGLSRGIFLTDSDAIMIREWEFERTDLGCLERMFSYKDII
ncbi:hypothetical protein J6590_075349 [Homalodisca vitripennis]|nr:hypothetical protein J6590_075349 [Homalodisca vitripennis]